MCVHTFVTDLQNVNITLRILFRPVADRLPDIFTNLGIDYDERVLPSIVNEVLKAVVVSTNIVLFSVISPLVILPISPRQSPGHISSHLFTSLSHHPLSCHNMDESSPV